MTIEKWKDEPIELSQARTKTPRKKKGKETSGRVTRANVTRLKPQLAHMQSVRDQRRRETAIGPSNSSLLDNMLRDRRASQSPGPRNLARYGLLRGEVLPALVRDGRVDFRLSDEVLECFELFLLVEVCR